MVYLSTCGKLLKLADTAFFELGVPLTFCVRTDHTLRTQVTLTLYFAILLHYT